MKRNKIMTMGAAAALGIMAMSTTATMAASTSIATSAANKTSVTQERKEGAQGHKAKRPAPTAEQIAAHQADMKARLAADVVAGKITQAQADQMTTDMANHKGGLRFGKSKAGETGGTAEQKSEREQKMANDLASVLGTTQADILAKLAAGSSPKDIIAASGKDAATIEAKLDAIRQANMKARLAADVASGKITQADADQMATDMANHKGGPGFAGHKSK